MYELPRGQDSRLGGRGDARLARDLTVAYAMSRATALPGRLLLRQAMNGAEPPDERAAIHAHDATARKHALKRFQGATVTSRLSECRYQHGAVDEAEVHVG